MQQITIEKLIFGGQGFARVDGKVYFVWNALPGEIVEIEILKKKKEYIEAVATKIITPSPERIEPKDPNFLSTSPWQIMSYEKENEWKKEIALEVYRRIGKEALSTINPDLVFDSEKYYGYRNKMEFSFAIDKTGRTCLGFFERGKKVRYAVEKSELADAAINETAQYILAWVRKHQITMRSLKSLIVRSDGNGKTIAALFIKDRLEFPDYPKLNDQMIGFQLYYSTHKSPASVPTDTLYSEGQDYIMISLRGIEFKVGLLSFFQVHLPVFEKALDDIYAHIPENSNLLDLYSGVGSIGLPIASRAQKLTLVDNNTEAIQYATENIEFNNIKNAEAMCTPTENIVELITSDTTVILDPPRAGLHQDVVKRLLEVKPKTIIYLSCDLSTQARDISLLYPTYNISFSRLYNFFPRTPHIEGLCVLSLS